MIGRRGGQGAAETATTRRRHLWRVPIAIWVAGAAVLCAGAGVADAYFRAAGSGPGHASDSNVVSLTVSAATPAAASLTPGNKSAVYFTIKNTTNAVPVTFTTLVSAGTVTSSTPTHCPASNVTVAVSTPQAITGVSVGADTTSGTLSIATVLQMSSGAPNTCQAKTFTVAITLSGKTT